MLSTIERPSAQDNGAVAAEGGQDVAVWDSMRSTNTSPKTTEVNHSSQRVCVDQEMVPPA